MTVVRIEAEPIYVNTWGGPAPDPKWSYTDKEGHHHDAGTKENRWPTLKWVVDRTYWCEDCRDEHQEGHRECVQCGEVIEPGMVHKGPENKMLPGPRRYYIDDVEVTEAEAEAAWAEIEAEKKETPPEGPKPVGGE